MPSRHGGNGCGAISFGYMDGGTGRPVGVEFALAPDRFRDFLANDFGYEDKYFLVGHSVPAADFPTSCPDLPTRGAAHGPRRAGARIRSISSSD